MSRNILNYPCPTITNGKCITENIRSTERKPKTSTDLDKILQLDRETQVLLKTLDSS